MRTAGKELVTTLLRVPLFAELSEAELRSIAEHFTREEFEPRMVVFSEGDRCWELLIVKSGAVRLMKTSPSGREQLISIERMGSTLAEVPVFDEGKYSMTAVAMEPTVLLRLPSAQFRRICMAQPDVALKVIKVLGQRVRHLDGLVEELSFSTVRGRLVAYLLRLAEEQGARTAQGLEFRLNENNEELAARLGTVRELISRNLGQLYGEGLIHMRGRLVTIPDVAALKLQACKNG